MKYTVFHIANHLVSDLLCLNDPIDNPDEANNDKKEEPPPEDHEDFVVDHVEVQYTDGVDILLFPACSPPPVVTRGCSTKFVNNSLHLKIKAVFYLFNHDPSHRVSTEYS